VATHAGMVLVQPACTARAQASAMVLASRKTIAQLQVVQCAALVVVARQLPCS